MPVLAFAPALAGALTWLPGVPVDTARAPALPTASASSAFPTLTPIYFAAGTTDIRPRQTKVLDAHAVSLQRDGNQMLLIEGHTDGPADHELSIEIGEQRARSAKVYLVSKGVEADHIAFVSHGGGRPACTERTSTCRAENRRVTFSTRRH